MGAQLRSVWTTLAEGIAPFLSPRNHVRFRLKADIEFQILTWLKFTAAAQALLSIALLSARLTLSTD